MGTGIVPRFDQVVLVHGCRCLPATVIWFSLGSPRSVAHAQIQRGELSSFWCSQDRHTCVPEWLTRGRRQAFNRLDIVLCAQHGVEAREYRSHRFPDWTPFWSCRSACKPGGAGIQTHPGHWLAEDVQLHAAASKQIQGRKSPLSLPHIFFIKKAGLHVLNPA